MYSQLPSRTTTDPNADADVNQLQDNIEALKGGAGAVAPTTTIAELHVSGIISPYAGVAAPNSGWLICNGETIGDALSGADYAGAAYETLFGILNISGWGNPGSAVWGDHDTVKLPDLRGMFLRGTGSNGTLNMADDNDFAGPAVGGSENDQFQGHWHTLKDASPLEADFIAGSDDEGAFKSSEGDIHNRVVGPVTDGSNGTPRSGDETRPVNYGITYIIKI